MAECAVRSLDEFRGVHFQADSRLRREHGYDADGRNGSRGRSAGFGYYFRRAAVAGECRDLLEFGSQADAAEINGNGTASDYRQTGNAAKTRR